MTHKELLEQALEAMETLRSEFIPDYETRTAYIDEIHVSKFADIQARIMYEKAQLQTNYINKKTGGIYTKVCDCINYTNDHEGEIMVLYHPINTKSMFVREYKEFYEKFEAVT